MLRYLMLLTIAGGVIYASYHPELLGLLDSSPTFKVWMTKTPVPPNNSQFSILNVQSREEKPITIRRVLMNDDPKCVRIEGAIDYRPDTPVKLGQVLHFGLGPAGFACEPVKVIISTDRGESTYLFN
jgi:hypothetical protein